LDTLLAQDATDRAVEAVRAGGVTLLCRHAATDSFNEREPVDYADPSTQRRLSPEGLAQSDSIGAGFRRLGIRLGEVVSSPMDRAIGTAERIAPGHELRIDEAWHTNGSDYGGPPNDRRRRQLAEVVVGGVRLVVSHIGTMSSVVPEVRDGVGEGDCAVVRGDGETHDYIGIIPWARWMELPASVR
jgi:phosphohistidine phosphatase SixA